MVTPGRRDEYPWACPELDPGLGYDGRMQIYLDDQTCDIQGRTLHDVLDAAGERLVPRKRIIVEVEINGRTLGPEEIDDEGSHELSPDAMVRLVSADPLELVVQMLEQTRTELLAARDHQHEAAELFQQDEPAKALAKIGEAVGVWQRLPEAVVHTVRYTGLDLDEMRVDQQPASLVIRTMIDRLGQFKALIEAGDSVAMADTLAYEWPEVVDQWDRLLRELVERVNAMR